MMCRCCGVKPPAGYVVRHGVYLDNLCVKCWKKGDADEIKNRTGRSAGGGRLYLPKRRQP